MAYAKQTWADAPATTSPISATRLGHIEDGIEAAATVADSAAGVAGSAQSAAATAQAAADAAAAGASAASSAAAAAQSSANAAASAASAAQTTANGRNRIYRQSTQPSSGVAGDTWFKTSEDNKPYIHDGSTWVATGFGNLAVGNLDAAAISTGTFAAARIAAASIDATKIAAGAVEAVKIAAGAVEAVKIAAGAVEASKIAAGAVTADKLDANAVTAKNIYTAASGTNRIILGPAAFYTEPRVIFDVDGSGASSNDPSVRGASTGLVIHGGTNGSSYTSITMSPSIGQPDRITLTASNGTNTPVAELDASFNRLGVTGSILASSNIATGAAAYFVMGSTTYNNAVGSATNLHVVSGADATQPYAIRRTTASSRRYKRDIADLADADLAPSRLYDLPVRQFKFRRDYIDPSDQYADRMVPGFIAEEVAEVYPVAANLDGDQAENWDLRYMVPGMLALIQEQKKAIDALTARVSTLEARLGPALPLMPGASGASRI